MLIGREIQWTDKGWIFWDEIYCDSFGPFHSLNICKAEFKEYCDLYLNYEIDKISSEN